VRNPRNCGTRAAGCAETRPADQHDERNGNLRHYENAAKRVSGGTARRAAALLQDVWRSTRLACKAGINPVNDPASTAMAAANRNTRQSQLAPISAKGVPEEPKRTSQLAPQYPSTSPRRWRKTRAESSRPAIAGTIASGGAQGRTEDHLPLPDRGAQEHQVRYVGAGDQQYQSHQTHEDPRYQGHELGEPRIGAGASLPDHPRVPPTISCGWARQSAQSRSRPRPAPGPASCPA